MYNRYIDIKYILLPISWSICNKYIWQLIFLIVFISETKFEDLVFCLFCFVCFVCLFVWYLEKGLCLCYEFAFDCYYKHHDQQSLGKWRVYIALQLTIYNKGESGKKIQDRNLRAGSEAEVIKEWCLLPCSLQIAHSSFIYNHVACAQKWYWSQLI